MGAKSAAVVAGGMEDFLSAFETRFWFTYRKEMPRLGSSILSSDVGFGCMIRAGQSMMAEGLCRVLFGPNWRLDSVLANPTTLEQYKSVRQRPARL